MYFIFLFVHVALVEVINSINHLSINCHIICLEISLTNNLVTDPSVNRPLDYYQESPFSLNRMSKAQRRCCKRGSRAARKAMNCNPGYRKDSPKLQILNDFKTGFKLAVQMHPRDKGFMKKVKRCFLKQDTAQYFTRCCKEFGVIREGY